MAKKLLIITLLLATSFSLMAQWTCETIDPEFDNEFDMNNSSAFVGFWKNGVMDGFGMVIQNKQIKYGIWESGFKKKVWRIILL